MGNGSWDNCRERIVLIDALRGFAILAILLIHSSNHFLYNSRPADSPVWLSQLDTFVVQTLYFLFEGKAYCIFALLFGFTYALQLDNRVKRGEDMAGRMVWRMFLLILFGIFNAAFFAGGDPLIFYALTALLIIPFRHASNRTLIALALILLIQPLEIIHHSYPIFEFRYIESYNKIMPELSSGNLYQTIAANLKYGIPGCLLWALETGRISQTLGLFFIGMLFYRFRFFSQSVKCYCRIFVISELITIALFLTERSYPSSFGRMYYNLFFAFSLILGFNITYNLTKEHDAWKHFITYGRMSLSNFIAQSLICSFFFYPWGLHLGVYTGATVSLILAFLLFIIQVQISHYYLKRFKQGPFETLWHKATWINLFSSVT